MAEAKADIDKKIRDLNLEWERAKDKSQNLHAILGKLCELYKEVVSLLRKQGVRYVEAASIVDADIAKYRNLLTQSLDELAVVEDEYKKVLLEKSRT